MVQDPSADLYTDPMGSEKGLCACVIKLCPAICSPMDCSPPGSLSMGFSREYWSGLPFSSLGAHPDPGIEPGCPALAGGFFTIEPLRKPSEGLSFNN